MRVLCASCVPGFLEIRRAEVDGDQLLGMILQEGAPGPRGRPAGAHHVLAYTALPNVEAEFEKLTVDAGCTRTGILPAHLADQIPDLAGNERSSGLARRTFQVQNRRKPPRCQAKTIWWLSGASHR